MLIERLHAFVWTCALELLVYAWWLHRFVPMLRPSPTVATVFALQLATQPLLWEYSLRLGSERSLLWMAEVMVSIVEAALLLLILRQAYRATLTVPIAVGAAFTANAFSWGVGTLLNRGAFS